MINLQETIWRINRFDFVPKIVFVDDNRVLLEFIEGRFPNVQSKKFVSAFASCLAHVHNQSISSRPASEFYECIQRDLVFLVGESAICRQESKYISQRIDSIMPNKIRTTGLSIIKDKCGTHLAP